MKSRRSQRQQSVRQRRANVRLRRLRPGPRFVCHPRFGDKPIRSGESFSRDEIHRAFWQYSSSSYERRLLFPETAVRADTSKQNYCCFPRRLYVDIARPCRKCGRWFIFFALEQKYWFEELGFYVDADCVHCQECRHAEHEMKAAVERYTALLGKEGKSVEEWRELSALGDILWESGYIRKAGTLQKSRIPKRLREIE